jgi:hypothetical protein
MEIQPQEIAYKKEIGKLKGVPVIEVGLKGGLHLVMVARKGKAETLGVGPHRAVARYIAKKKEKDLELTELTKADYVDPRHFEFCLEEYETLTNTVRKLQGIRE